MLNTPSPASISSESLGKGTPQQLAFNSAIRRSLPVLHGPRADVGVTRPERQPGSSSPTVSVAPHHAAIRRGIKLHGMAAEFVEATTHQRLDFSFRSSMHLLAAYEKGVRRDGVSHVEGAAQSRLSDGAG